MYKRQSQDWVNLNFATKISLQAEVDNRSNALIALMTRLTANGIDANLAATNNATGLNLDDASFVSLAHGILTMQSMRQWQIPQGF